MPLQSSDQLIGYLKINNFDTQCILFTELKSIVISMCLQKNIGLFQLFGISVKLL